ncbi:MAG: C_GCAxxG_C_C family protein [Spirochaetales bacterium]|nr:C_GCAxxG_C_C family protein [Spirochaetales bacterium]HPO03453.1 C-GCAxxG-C-C family protein [Treponemataceae bacterium]
MTKAEKARNMFTASHNCAQSVAAQFAGEAGIDADAVCRAACAFGAGGGRKQLTCGAVSGGLLALSLVKGRGLEGVKEDQEKSYALARAFIDRFEEKFGTAQCRALLDGTDLMTEEGQTRFRTERLGEKCALFVEESTKMVEELLSE